MQVCKSLSVMHAEVLRGEVNACRDRKKHLPGEAEFTVAASLFDGEHTGVCGAGEQELSHFKRSGNAETSTFSRTVKPLKSPDAARHGDSSNWVSAQEDPGEAGDVAPTPSSAVGRHRPNNSSSGCSLIQ